MVYYKCEKCEYTTTHKHNFNKHLKKKTTCYPKDTVMVYLNDKSTIGSEKLRNGSEKLRNGSEKLRLAPFCSGMDNNENDCMYCGKQFNIICLVKLDFFINSEISNGCVRG